MDIQKIEKLIEHIETSGIAEIEIHKGEDSVRISRYSSSAPVALPQTLPPSPAVPPVQASPPTISSPQSEASDKEVEGHTLISPMVGTFYRSPSPTSKAFVEGGQMEGRTH